MSGLDYYTYVMLNSAPPRHTKFILGLLRVSGPPESFGFDFGEFFRSVSILERLDRGVVQAGAKRGKRILNQTKKIIQDSNPSSPDFYHSFSRLPILYGDFIRSRYPIFQILGQKWGRNYLAESTEE